MSIRFKLLVAFAAFTVCSVGLSFLAYRNISEIGRSERVLLITHAQQDALLRALTDWHSVRHILVEHDVDDADRRELLRDATRALAKDVDVLAQATTRFLAMVREEDPLSSELEEQLWLDRLGECVEEVHALRVTDRGEVSADLRERIARLDEEITGVLEAWIADEAGEVRAAEQRTEALLSAARRGSVVVPILAILALILAHIPTARRMRRQLRELHAGAQRIAKGDLETKVAVLSRDELGALGGAMNAMASDLREITVAKSDLERAYAELRRTQDQLLHAQKMEAIGRLAGGVSHEFNNLLTVIQTYATFVKQAVSDDPATREDVEEILRASTRASTLTRQLLLFSKAGDCELAVLDVNEAVRRMQPLLMRLLPEPVSLVLSLERGLWPVEAPPSHIDQILMNLVVNSVQAIEGEGRITVRTRSQVVSDGSPEVVTLEPGEYAVLEVGDTGPGIPEGVRERIFEPFFTTREQGAGTGLGLSTCYAVARRLGGSILVGSEEGEGARLSVYLPRSDRGESRAAPSAPVSAAPAGHGVILVVEDEPAVRRLAVRALDSKGYAVLQARNGEEALEVLGKLQTPVDLIITDVCMPVMGGVELAARARDVCASPVLFMSGYAESTAELLANASDLLQKPFGPDQLNRKVHEVLARSTSVRH